jgi:hypothetical protein
MRTVAEAPIFIRYGVGDLVRSRASGFHHLHCDEPRCRLSHSPVVVCRHTKAKYDALPASFLAQLRQGVEDAL